MSRAPVIISSIRLQPRSTTNRRAITTFIQRGGTPLHGRGSLSRCRRQEGYHDLPRGGRSLGRRHIDRLEAEGKFPRRVPIAQQRVAWVASEIDEFAESRIAKRSKRLTPFLPIGFGDEMLKFNGIGERITGAMYNNNAPDATARVQVPRDRPLGGKQGLTVTIRWQEDKSVHQLLDLYEEVNKETPIAPLRWSIAHLDNASSETLLRMKALGIGWTMQDAMYLGGDRMAAQAGEAA
ncbi:AlpA family phage regulatory protein, partial [Bradyrhizobium diazoefficiens]|nr:AlpA family phage regulatory protein [Bradyrhizobium diazoefficiens]